MERNEHDEVLHDDTTADERPKARGGEGDELVEDGAPEDEVEEEAEDELPGDFVDEALLEEDAATPELVRLNKYLADHGVASRRRCDELIQGGQVTVDGAIVTELGTKIDPERHKVEIDGFVLAPKKLRKRYYLLNKPGGVVCTNEARELRPRAVDLVTDPRKGRIYTVGRLDEESKGLIILTNDGEFAQRIMHPRHGVEKTYLVRVRGKIDDAAMQKIRNGIHLSEGRTSGARVLVHERQRDSSWLSVTIHEGMNREIRRSFARVGYKVLELKRTRIGPLTDRGLKIGRWRELTRSEIDALVKGAPRVSATDARGKKGPRPPRTFSGKGGFVEAEHRREERVRSDDGAPRREQRERSSGGAPRREAGERPSGGAPRR
ncbi:MAG: rRNA pseudouridine synthase, partial [Planctomycetes bacterium]|nr:rRNA pseudouridine synthase [Planctomycetota bacterium]